MKRATQTLSLLTALLGFAFTLAWSGSTEAQTFTDSFAGGISAYADFSAGGVTIPGQSTFVLTGVENVHLLSFFSWGADVDLSGSGSGQTGSQLSATNLVLRRATDSGSAAIFSAWARGRTLDVSVRAFRSAPQGGGEQVVHLECSRGRIVSIKQKADAKGAMMDEIRVQCVSVSVDGNELIPDPAI